MSQSSLTARSVLILKKLLNLAMSLPAQGSSPPGSWLPRHASMEWTCLHLRCFRTMSKRPWKTSRRHRFIPKRPWEILMRHCWIISSRLWMASTRQRSRVLPCRKILQHEFARTLATCLLASQICHQGMKSACAAEGTTGYRAI